MPTRRPPKEDQFILSELAAELAALRINNEFFSRFVSYAAKQLGSTESRIITRLRMVFGGRTPPASFALLLKEFFRSGAHVGLVEEVAEGIRFQAPAEMLPDLKRAILRRKGVERITRAVLTFDSSVISHFHLWVHAPDQRDVKWRDIPVRNTPNAVQSVHRFWTPFMERWDVPTKIGRSIREFPSIHSSPDDDPFSIKAPDSFAEDRLWFLRLCSQALNALFEASPMTTIDPDFMVNVGGIMEPSLPSSSWSEKASPKAKLSQRRGTALHGWITVWHSGVLEAPIASVAERIRQQLQKSLRGAKRAAQEIQPYLSESTLPKAPVAVEFQLLAANKILEDAWREFLKAYAEPVRQQIIRFYNDHNSAMGEPASGDAAEQDTMDRPEIKGLTLSLAVDYLETVGLEHDALALKCIHDLVAHPERKPRAERSTRSYDGINLATLVASALPVEEAAKIDRVYGYVYGEWLAVVCEQLFDVGYAGDLKSPSSKLIVRRKAQQGAEILTFRIRNRAGHLSERRLDLASFVALACAKKAKN